MEKKVTNVYVSHGGRQERWVTPHSSTDECLLLLGRAAPVCCWVACCNSVTMILQCMANEEAREAGHAMDQIDTKAKSVQTRVLPRMLANVSNANVLYLQ